MLMPIVLICVVVVGHASDDGGRLYWHTTGVLGTDWVKIGTRLYIYREGRSIIVVSRCGRRCMDACILET